jgi:16S rRNA processing protein RimM
VTDRPRYVAVGRIARAHGVRGEVAILPLTQVPSRFEPGSRLFASEDESRPMIVAGARPHADRVLVRFEGVADRSAADSLRGMYLFVRSSESPSLPEDEFWPHDLVGCDVVTEGGGALGRLEEIIRTPANDVWTVRSMDGKETLVPALRDVVADVDLEGRRVVVREVPGLTTP